MTMMQMIAGAVAAGAVGASIGWAVERRIQRMSARGQSLAVAALIVMSGAVAAWWWHDDLVAAGLPVSAARMAGVVVFAGLALIYAVRALRHSDVNSD